MRRQAADGTRARLQAAQRVAKAKPVPPLSGPAGSPVILTLIKKCRSGGGRVGPGPYRRCMRTQMAAAAWASMKAAIWSFSSSIRLKPPWLPGTMATSACGMRVPRA